MRLQRLCELSVPYQRSQEGLRIANKEVNLISNRCHGHLVYSLLPHSSVLMGAIGSVVIHVVYHLTMPFVILQ